MDVREIRLTASERRKRKEIIARNDAAYSDDMAELTAKVIARVENEEREGREIRERMHEWAMSEGIDKIVNM